MATQERILLIDRHPEWLQFAGEVLQEQYEIITAGSFEEANECCIRKGQSQEFDLILVGLDLAANNLATITQLSKAPSDGWRFVVMFPIFQQDETLRMFFKAGVLDCADKPYEREGLLKLVADELTLARKLGGIKRFMRWQKAPRQGMLDFEGILALETLLS